MKNMTLSNLVLNILQINSNWHMLTLVKTKRKLELYIDANLVASQGYVKGKPIMRSLRKYYNKLYNNNGRNDV